MIDKNILKGALAEALNERQSCEHESHHEWLTQKIKAERERKLMYRAITKSVISWSVPAILTAIVFFVQKGHWPGQ